MAAAAEVKTAATALATTTGPAYELKYFGPRGRGEFVRLTLALAGVDWKDTFLGATWMEEKSKLLLGQLPVLVERTALGSKTIPQSAAIGRHIARKYGLYGKDEEEHTVHDVIIDTLGDYNKIGMAFYTVQKDAVIEAFKTIPNLITAIEAFLAVAGTGWLVGTAPGLADAWVYAALDSIRLFESRLVASTSVLAFLAKFESYPAIATYRASKQGPEGTTANKASKGYVADWFIEARTPAAAPAKK